MGKPKVPDWQPKLNFPVKRPSEGSPVKVLKESNEGTSQVPRKPKVTIMWSQRKEPDQGITMSSSSNPYRKYLHQCTVCIKSFWRSNDLKRHLQRHSDDRPCVCHCGKAFKTKVDLTEHKLSHGPSSFKCELCPSTFTSARLLKAHVARVHTNNDEKPYICTWPGCGKGFIWHYFLQQHVVVHSDIRPYICEDCGETFKLKHNLKTHSVQHEDRTKEDCDHCGRSFFHRDLKGHKDGHLRENNVNCHLCDFKPKEEHNVDKRKDEYRAHCLSIDHAIQWGPSNAVSGYKPLPIFDDEETSDTIRIVEFPVGKELFTKCLKSDCRVCSKVCNAEIVYFHNVRHVVNQNLTCKSTNVIYMMTCLDGMCKNFSKMYVGQTEQTISRRINQHFTGGHGPFVEEFFKCCRDHLNVILLLQTENVQEVLDIAEVNFIKVFECRNRLKFGLNILAGGKKGRDQAAAWQENKKKFV